MALHTISKTRTEHICHNCDEVIPKGSKARYRYNFSGSRDYYHYEECPKFERKTIKKIKGKHGKISDEISAEIGRLYDNGVSAENISIRFGVVISTIYNILHREEVATKRTYIRYTPKLCEEIVSLYQRGSSRREVAEILGASSTTVGRAIKDAKVVRPTGSARRLYRRMAKKKASKVIIFTCKICGGVKPISDLIENKMFRPPIYGCRDCV